MADLKMRLTGLEDEVAAAVAILAEDPAFLSCSPLYPNRGNDKRVRVYLEFDGAALTGAPRPGNGQSDTDDTTRRLLP